jgi:hypothetical protein
MKYASPFAGISPDRASDRSRRRVALAPDQGSFQSVPILLRPRTSAEFYRLEKDRSYRLAATATLLNPVAPAEFFVTDGGFLITLDNWHNLGYGKAVSFYTPEGKPIRSYELSDLFTKSEIDGFGHSVSSIEWRKFSGAYIRAGGDTFNITINDTGSPLIFELNGAYQYCETRGGTFQCRATNQGRAWRAFREPSPGAR